MAVPLAFLLLLQESAPKECFAEVVGAIERTAAGGYAFIVRGKLERSGGYTPGGLLFSRIGRYQSARRGAAVLVKGPDGLWKRPEERSGENVENPDPDAPAVVRTLREAAPPHEMVRELLRLADKIHGPEDREVNGVMCRRYKASFPPGVLKDHIEKQLSKEVGAGAVRRPDDIHWSTAKWSVRIYAGKADGRLVKVVDERSVRISYRVPDQQPDLRRYKIEMEFEFSALDPAKVPLPPGVRERLGAKD